MNQKTLVVYPEKCNGCGDCEKACIERHTGEGHVGPSCIQVLKEENDDTFFLPSTCRQCEEPPCLAACPNEAIYRDEEMNRVMVNYEKCVGCKMCFSACPFGAMEFDRVWVKAVKCDLCGGKPECVKVCERGAIAYVNPDVPQTPQITLSALKAACLTHRISV